MSKAIVLQALALARAIVVEEENETGVPLLGQLDLRLDTEGPLPAAAPSEAANDNYGPFNTDGFSIRADSLGRVRIKAAEQFIADRMAEDPIRAARLPSRYYWPPSFKASTFPTDDARELAWKNFIERYRQQEYAGFSDLYAQGFSRAKPSERFPTPASLLPWVQTNWLTDTMAWAWETTDQAVILRDLATHWEHHSHEDASPKLSR